MKKLVVGLIILFLILIGVLVALIFHDVKRINNNINSKTNNKNMNTDIIEEKDLPTTTSLSLVMVGDALIHESVYANFNNNGNYDFKPMLDDMKPIIEKYDLAYYNQETILGGKDIGLSTYPRFNSPYEVGDAFLDSGFNLVSLANNHTLDRGETAINNSCNYWKDKNAYTSGSYCSMEDREKVKIGEINDITYAMLSYTTEDNGLSIPSGKSYYLNLYNSDVVKKDIEKYRDKVDLLLVAMHWGQEYTHTPINSQKEIAAYLASLGVDIVIGAHPHVVEPIEKIDNTLVIYSLGNFVSAQRGIEKLTGLMVSVNVNKDLKTNKISVDDVEAELLYTYSDNNKGYRANYKVIPYTKLNNSLLNNYQEYYNRYMNIVTNGQDWIKRGDYSGDIK